MKLSGSPTGISCTDLAISRTEYSVLYFPFTVIKYWQQAMSAPTRFELMNLASPHQMKRVGELTKLIFEMVFGIFSVFAIFKEPPESMNHTLSNLCLSSIKSCNVCSRPF